MKLFTEDQKAKLLENGRRVAATEGTDDAYSPSPVVKWFTPDGAATWLISEIDPENSDIAYGVADLGMGCVEYGAVSIPEILALRGRMGLPVERDLHFTAKADIFRYLYLGARLGNLEEAIQALNH